MDAAEIAAKFDGGGHVRAAGFSMKGEPEHEIIEAICEQSTDERYRQPEIFKLQKMTTVHEKGYIYGQRNH